MEHTSSNDMLLSSFIFISSPPIFSSISLSPSPGRPLSDALSLPHWSNYVVANIMSLMESLSICLSPCCCLWKPSLPLPVCQIAFFCLIRPDWIKADIIREKQKEWNAWICLDMFLSALPLWSKLDQFWKDNRSWTKLIQAIVWLVTWTSYSSDTLFRSPCWIFELLGVKPCYAPWLYIRRICSELYSCSDFKYMSGAIQFVQTFLFFCFSSPGSLKARALSAYCLFPPSSSPNPPSGSPFLPSRSFFFPFSKTSLLCLYPDLLSLSFLFVFPPPFLFNHFLLFSFFSISVSLYRSFLLASASIISPSSSLLLSPYASVLPSLS